MEMIIMLAVIAALIALVYWKNVKNDVSVSAGQRPEEQEVTAKLDYFPKRPAGMLRFITAAFCATAFLLI